MTLGDALKLPIYCLDCNEALDKVEIGEIEYGQFITCPKCTSRFNLWGLYLNFYENMPLAKKIADSITGAVLGDGYTVRGGKTGDLTKVDDFLNELRGRGKKSLSNNSTLPLVYLVAP